jgi:hypothetical protein
LDINGVVIEMDEQFFAQKDFVVERIRNLLTPGRELTFRIFGNESGLEYWEIRERPV